MKTFTTFRKQVNGGNATNLMASLVAAWIIKVLLVCFLQDGLWILKYIKIPNLFIMSILKYCLFFLAIFAISCQKPIEQCLTNFADNNCSCHGLLQIKQIIKKLPCPLILNIYTCQEIFSCMLSTQTVMHVKRT